MAPADFARFMKRNAYTLDGVAAELGISRRLAAYHAKEREIPRSIALVRRHIETARQGSGAAAVGMTAVSQHRHPPARSVSGELRTRGRSLTDAQVTALEQAFGVDDPVKGASRDGWSTVRAMMAARTAAIW